MTGRATASRFLQSVLHNGLGRYVCQLSRITLAFSKGSQTSRGVRDYVENHVVDFAKKHQGTVVYISPRRCHVPKVTAEYLNGGTKVVALNSKSAEEIAQVITLMANQSGLDVVRIRKPFHTEHPSIQGLWQPFVNKRSQLSPRIAEWKGAQ
uniref:large ribosomal subunit protein mL43 n=1 Tax=Myxine glutinosa TaxID=7769 RepID=UPI00358E3F40